MTEDGGIEHYLDILLGLVQVSFGPIARAVRRDFTPRDCKRGVAGESFVVVVIGLILHQGHHSRRTSSTRSACGTGDLATVDPSFGIQVKATCNAVILFGCGMITGLAPEGRATLGWRS